MTPTDRTEARAQDTSCHCCILRGVAPSRRATEFRHEFPATTQGRTQEGRPDDQDRDRAGATLHAPRRRITRGYDDHEIVIPETGSVRYRLWN